MPEFAHEFPLCSRADERLRAALAAVRRRAVPRHRQGPRRRPLELGAADVRQLLPRARPVAGGHASWSRSWSSTTSPMSHVRRSRTCHDPDVVAAFAERGRHRAPPGRALPAHRGRHPRHQPQGVERLEGKLLEDLFRATRRVLTGEPLRARRGAGREAGRSRAAAAPVRALRTASRSSCGRSSTPPTSCATTRRRSPGRRATCTTASTPTSRWSRRASRRSARACRCWSTCRDQRGAVRAHLRLLRARRLQHRRGQGPHHAQRLRARHLHRHGPGARRALPRPHRHDRDRAAAPSCSPRRRSARRAAAACRAACATSRSRRRSTSVPTSAAPTTCCRSSPATGPACSTAWRASSRATSINLQTARINTLGDRAEDVFLVSGEALANSKNVLQLEQELLEDLSLPETAPQAVPI